MRKDYDTRKDTFVNEFHSGVSQVSFNNNIAFTVGVSSDDWNTMSSARAQPRG